MPLDVLHVGGYTGSLSYGIAHDDLIAYLDPVIAGDWAWALTEFQTHGLWMPLVYLDYMITTKIFGIYMFVPSVGDSLAFGVKSLILHAGNIIQHTINAILIIFVTRRLTGNQLIAAAAGLIWMAHPTMPDTVTLAVERKNTLSLLFMLASLLAYQAYSESRKFRTMALCFGLFVCAAASKPTTLMLPIIFLVLDAYRVNFDLRKLTLRQGLEKIPFFVVSFCVGTINLIGQTLAAPRTPGDLVTGMANFAAYLLHVIWPVGLSQTAPEYGSELPYLAAAGVAALVMILAAAWFLRRRNPVATFGLLWFLVFVMPALNIAMVIGTSPTYGHNLYIPLAGLTLAAASYIKPIVAVAAVALFAVLSSQQIHRWDHYNETEFMAAFTTHAHGQLMVCQREHEEDPAVAVQCIDGVLAKTKYVWQQQQGLTSKLALLPADSPQRPEIAAALAKVNADIQAFNESRWWMRLWTLAGRPVPTHKYTVVDPSGAPK